MVREALPNLRAGAHDEDTSLQLNRFLNDHLLAPMVGVFFQHFYNPDSETGLKNVFNPATKKAMDYIGGAKVMLCKIKKDPWYKDARERLMTIWAGSCTFFRIWATHPIPRMTYMSTPNPLKLCK